MKNLLLIVLLNLSSIFIISAQFDSRFYFPSKEWNNIENLNYEDLYFSIDTIKLHGILIKPETTPKTTVLFFHGSAGNVSTYTPITKPLVNADFQVFMIDFRGYGKSTGTPTHNNIASDAQIVFNSILKNNDQHYNFCLFIFINSPLSEPQYKLLRLGAGKVRVSFLVVYKRNNLIYKFCY